MKNLINKLKNNILFTFIYLCFNSIVLLYCAYNLILFPENTELWFIRILGFVFMIKAIELVFESYKYFLLYKHKDIIDTIKHKLNLK